MANRLLTVLLFALLGSGCSSVAFDLPPLTDVPAERDEGRIIWHELITHTPEASQRFYEQLFGWQFEDPGTGSGVTDRGGYRLIRHNGQLIGGMIDPNVHFS